MRLKNNLLLLPVFFMAGCASLPHSGPSVQAMNHASKKHFVIRHVNTEMALTMRRELQDAMNRETLKELQTIGKWNRISHQKKSGLIQAGDVLHMNLWTNQIALFSGNNLSSPLHKTPLGRFTVDDNGLINLPYIGKVDANHLTLNELTQKINDDYRKTGEFIEPDVSIRWAKKGILNGVLISGAVRHAGLVHWHDGGMSLSAILAHAGIDGNHSTSHSKSSSVSNDINYGNMIEMSYHHEKVVIPFSLVYAHHLKIPVGTHILVTRAAPYKITLLGGGVKKQGDYTFYGLPSVNTVLSASGGLNNSTSDDRRLFVLQPDLKKHARSILYVLSWNTAKSLLVSQEMPLKNGDILYVPAAPIVSVDKAAQIFSSFLLPATVVGSAIK